MKWEQLIAVSLLAAPAMVHCQEAPCPEKTQDPIFYNSSSRKEVKGGQNLFVTGDLLFWQASEDGLEFVVDNKHSTTAVIHGSADGPHFGWDFGFRVGMGYNLKHDQWDLYLNFTHYHGNAESTKTADAGGALFPLWQSPFMAPDGGYVTHAKANWAITMNMADFELGRDFYVGRWLSFRPFLGLKGGTIQEKYHIEYSGGTAVPEGDEDQIHMTNHFWGVGVRLGVDSLWNFTKEWGLYGNGALSLLPGQYNIQQKEKFERTSSPSFKIQDHISMTLTFAELSLGLQWDHMFAKDRYHLGMKLGWELNLLFDHNLFMKLVSATAPGIFTQSDGDLSFQGLTFGLRFDF